MTHLLVGLHPQVLTHLFCGCITSEWIWRCWGIYWWKCCGMLRIYWRSNTICGEDVFLCHAKGWIKPIGDGGTWNQTDVERKSDDSSSVLGWAIALDDRPKRGPMLLLIQFSISTFHCCQNIVVVSTKVWSSESRKRRTSVCVCGVSLWFPWTVLCSDLMSPMTFCCKDL